MACFDLIDVGQQVRSRLEVTFLGDDERALERRAKRVVRAERHARCRLADRRHMNGSRIGSSRERRTRRCAPVDGGERRIEKVEEESAAGIHADRLPPSVFRLPPEKTARADRPPGPRREAVDGRRKARAWRQRTTFTGLRRSARRRALAASDRSSCRRSRYSRVTSPVTYSPEKQEVSNSTMFASS